MMQTTLTLQWLADRPCASPLGLRSRYWEVGGCRVHARVSTAAADPGRVPVVLVHGLGVSGSYFVRAAELLANEFPVYVPDLPGHGKSGTPAEPHDVPRLADDLVAWMGVARLGRAALVANSLGCQVIVDAAARYPERVERLVLVGPAADPAARTAPRQTWRLLMDAPYEDLSLIPILVVDYLRMGPRFWHEFWAMLRDRPEDKMPRVAAPALVVRGEHDPVATPRWAEEAARLLRAGPVVTIPGWGHAAHYSAARQFVDAVTPFLRALVSR